MKPRTQHFSLEPEEIKLLLASLEAHSDYFDIGGIPRFFEIGELLNKIKNQLTLET